MEETKFTSQENELLELLTYFKGMIVIDDATPLYNRLILQEEMDHLNNQITDITDFAKEHTAFRNIMDAERIKNWTTRKTIECPHCKTEYSMIPVGEIMLDDGLTYFQYYCDRCFMNFEANQPNNTPDMIVFSERYLADLGNKVSGGKTKQETLGITNDQMRQKRQALINIKETNKKFMTDNHLAVEANSSFMEEIMAELIHWREAKAHFINLQQGGQAN